MVRMRKFLKRGWVINAGQILKIALQISELNLKDPVVLEDQLVGVDTMYFVALLEHIWNDKKGEIIDTDYVVSVIDKIF